MSLRGELEHAAEAAAGHAEPDERVEGVIAVEPRDGERLYLCAYQEAERRTWLVLDSGGRPVEDRRRVRDAVSIAALCELAEESAGGGELDELRSRLVALRLTENPPGIDEAEEAAAGLQRTIGTAPRVATPRFLEDVNAATRRLEETLGEGPGSPFAEAMKAGAATIQQLTADVEAAYKRPLS